MVDLVAIAVVIISFFGYFLLSLPITGLMEKYSSTSADVIKLPPPNARGRLSYDDFYTYAYVRPFQTKDILEYEPKLYIPNNLPHVYKQGINFKPKQKVKFPIASRPEPLNYSFIKDIVPSKDDGIVKKKNKVVKENMGIVQPGVTSTLQSNVQVREENAAIPSAAIPRQWTTDDQYDEVIGISSKIDPTFWQGYDEMDIFHGSTGYANMG
jgi:hypothetical protein